MEFTAEAIRRAERVRLIIFDVDGVLTDGGIYIGPDGELFKPFFCRDGLGIEERVCRPFDLNALDLACLVYNVADINDTLYSVLLGLLRIFHLLADPLNHGIHTSSGELWHLFHHDKDIFFTISCLRYCFGFVL